MTIKHFGQHDETCYPCKLKTVSFSAAAMPTRKPEVGATVARERKLVRDRTAFKAMHQQGIQPGRLNGAAELQDHATTKHEIETGRLLPPQIAGKVETAVKELAK